MRYKALLPLVALGAVAVFAAVGGAASPNGPQLSNIPANTKATGYAPASRLSAGLWQTVVAQGSMKLENPSGIITNYGYENDSPSPTDATVPLMVGLGTGPEAQKTEPDKNTYLAFKQSQTGPDATYDYGTHFLYQGHEGAASVNGLKQGYITRINLDADSAHRVTLLASTDKAGNPIQTIDGSTWDPWAQRLLLTTENASAPTYAATASYPSTVEDISGAIGRGGYEGIQNDSDGNIWIVEDIGGTIKAGTTAAKIPNSFIYRYVPAKPGDLAHGKLQVLQAWNDKHPITIESQTVLNAADQVALHSYGTSFATRWVTIHNTAVDGNAPFNANTLAKAAHGTPFKRPENGVFRPGSSFRSFFFTETGDTSSSSEENATAGGWGGLFSLEQASPSADTGKLSVFFKGSAPFSGFDNLNLPLEEPARGRRGRGRRAARLEERARLRLLVRRDGRLLERPEPAGALAGRGPRSVGDDRLRQRRLREERR